MGAAAPATVLTRSFVARLRLGHAAVLIAVCAGVLGLAVSARAASRDPDLQLARVQAARLLALVPLPPGTATLPIDPFTSTPFAASGPPGRWQVLVASHWLAPVPALAARSYLMSHQPPGSTQTSISFGGGTLDWDETLELPTSGLALTSATLDISIGPYGRSQTEIDTLATVLWKPTWEQIPAAARSLRVSVDNGPTVIVSGRHKIAVVARLFAELPNVSPGSFSCPAGFDPATAVVRLDGADGLRLGTLTVSDGGCDEVHVRLGSRRGAPLRDDGLLNLLWREGGVRTCRASQLTGTIKRAVPKGAPSINIELKNTSPTECSLDGYPQLRLLTPDGRTLDVKLTRDKKQFSASLATAAPGDTFVISATWPKARTACPAQTIDSVAIRLPRAPGKLHASSTVPVSVCGPITVSPVFNPGPFSAAF